MIAYIDLPISLYGYALSTTIYLHNRVPSKSVMATPYEIWYGKRPSLKHVMIWGCSILLKNSKHISWSPDLTMVDLWGIIYIIRGTISTFLVIKKYG